MWLRASMTILFLGRLLGLLFLSCGRINFLLVCSSYVSGDNRPCVAVRPTGQRKRFFWFITQNKPKTKMEKSTTFSCYLGSARSSRSIFEGKIIRWKIETIGCLWFMNCFRLKFCASFSSGDWADLTVVVCSFCDWVQGERRFFVLAVVLIGVKYLLLFQFGPADFFSHH